MGHLILNVGDFEPQRDARSSILRAAGLDVIEAATGREALRLTRERHPALVVLDVQLPDIDGLEVCRKIKAGSSTSSVLVLQVSSTLRDPAARSEVLNNGADAYLAEPAAPDELLAQVWALLRLAAAERLAGEARRAVRASEDKYRRLFEHMTEAFFLAEVMCDEAGRPRDYRHLDVNPAFERSTGLERQSVVGRTVRQVVPDVEDSWIETCGKVALTGTPAVCEQFSAFFGKLYASTLYSPAPGVLACLFRDVTETRRAENDLRASNERLRLAQQAGSVGVFDWNLLTGEVLWTPELEVVYGMAAPADPRKRHEEWFRAVHPADRDRLVRETADWLQSMVGEQEEEYRLLVGGEERWIAGRSMVVRDVEGRPVRIVGTNQDITKRKRAEDRLARDNELLSGIARIFREVLTSDSEEALGRACLEVAEKVTDSRFGFLGEVNAETGELELIAISDPRWGEGRLPQTAHERARLPTALAGGGLCGRVLAGGASLFSNDLPSHRDGVGLPAGQTALSAFLGVPLQLGGRTTGMIGLGNREGGFGEDQVRDIELLAAAIVQAFAGKRAEQAQRDAMLTAQRREAEIEAMYDAAPMGLCVMDREGRYLRINRHMAEINGHPPEAHIGRSFHEVVPGLADQAERLLRQVLETGRPITGIEIRGEVPSQPGVERTWIENWVPVMDAGGTIAGVHAAAEEITSRKRMEEELRRANHVKDEFLATLSHELRTPLNAILGWSDMLRRGLLDQAVSRQAIEAIARNAEAQMHLISDVLDVSRMIAGKLRLELEEVDLLQVAHQATTSLRPAADAKGVGLTLDAASTGAVVTGDPHRLQQIVWNLLSNAIKFTGSGGRVTVRLATAADHAVLSVADTGVGIRRELLASVFERFVQADSSTTRRHGGLGLGLSIVRQLAELHGGMVSAESDGEGRGATFVVTLPLRSDRVAQGSSAPAARPAASELHGLRVLVLDDVEDARTLVAAIVRGAGGEAAAAASVDEALAMVASAPPAVIVADIAMPSADGYEFLRRLRTERGSRIPVIALTAYGSLADREKALAAGFVEHLGKPVLRDHLLAALRRASAPPTGASLGVTAPK